MKKIFKAHTTNFRDRLMELVFERRMDPTVEYKAATSTLDQPQPALPANIAPSPAPTLQELLDRRVSRL